MEYFTEQEQRVLSLIVQGFSTCEIAKNLNVSNNDAKICTNMICKKLEAKNKVQAVVKAITHNIVEI